MTQAAANDDGRRGMILVVVLWSVAMMSMIVVALSSLVQSSVSSAGLDTDVLRSRLALEAGVEVGVALVLNRRAEERVYFDGTPAVTDIGGGRLVEISVRNAAGLVDVNRADPALIAAVAEASGASPQEAQAFVEGIAEEKARQPAKRNQPQELVQAAADGKEPPPPPAYSTVEQLFGLPGVGRDTIEQLLPLLTLYSVDGKVNPMAAPDAVMGAVPELSGAEIQRFADAKRRRQGAAPDVAELVQGHAAYLALNPARVFQIEARLVSGPGLIANSRIRAAVLIDDGLPVRVLSWSW